MSYHPVSRPKDEAPLRRGPAGAECWSSRPAARTDRFAALLGRLEAMVARGPIDVERAAERVAATSVEALESELPLGVPARLAPLQVIPAGPAKDLPHACRALVNRELAPFCAAVLREWERLCVLEAKGGDGLGAFADRARAASS